MMQALKPIYIYYAIDCLPFYNVYMWNWRLFLSKM